MSILGPSGAPVTASQPASDMAFEVSSDFSLQTGRGTVKLTVPTAALLSPLRPYLRHGDACTGDETCTCGLSNLITEAHLRYQMMPAQARMLGVRLVAESEAAILNAVAMRILLELGQVRPDQAVQVLVTIAQGTRDDHAEAYRQHVQRTQAEEMMMGDDHDGHARPS